MLEAKFDKGKNLLTVRYEGAVSASDTRKLASEMKRSIADAERGFRLLTDLSGLDAMELACDPDIEQMMDFCNRKGVALIVRVIPDPRKDIGFNIMSLFHYNQEVRLITCESLAEAARVLDQNA